MAGVQPPLDYRRQNRLNIHTVSRTSIHGLVLTSFHSEIYRRYDKKLQF